MAKTDNLYRTPAEWTDSNPVLGAGQVGLERFTGKFKIGDGSKTWEELQYQISRRNLAEFIDPLIAQDVIDGGAP